MYFIKKITARKLLPYSFYSPQNATISAGISPESEKFVMFKDRGMLLFARNTTQK